MTPDDELFPPPSPLPPEQWTREQYDREQMASASSDADEAAWLNHYATRHGPVAAASSATNSHKD